MSEPPIHYLPIKSATLTREATNTSLYITLNKISPRFKLLRVWLITEKALQQWVTTRLLTRYSTSKVIESSGRSLKHSRAPTRIRTVHWSHVGYSEAAFSIPIFSSQLEKLLLERALEGSGSSYFIQWTNPPSRTMHPSTILNRLGAISEHNRHVSSVRKLRL